MQDKQLNTITHKIHYNTTQIFHGSNTLVTPIDMINIGQDNRVTEAGGGDGDDVPLASVVTQRHSDS